MSVALLLKRPTLSFPGRAPGFDQSHMAASQTRFSGVSPGTGFLNLLRGSVGTISGAPGKSIKSFIGPNAQYVTGGDSHTFSGMDSTNFPSSTIAAIIILNSTASNQYIFANNNSATGVALNVNVGSFCWTMFGVIQQTSAITLVANVPYFVAASQNGALSISFIAKRLDTGVVVTSSTASGTPVAPNGNYVVGTGPGGTGITTGGIAAMMYSGSYNSMQTLLQWSQDPWSFWYPQPTDFAMMICGTIAAAAGRPRTLTLLGVG